MKRVAVYYEIQDSQDQGVNFYAFSNQWQTQDEIKIKHILMNFPHSFEGQNYHIRFKTEIEDQSLPKITAWIDILNMNARAPFIKGAVHMKLIKLQKNGYSKIYNQEKLVQLQLQKDQEVVKNPNEIVNQKNSIPNQVQNKTQKQVIQSNQNQNDNNTQQQIQKGQDNNFQNIKVLQENEKVSKVQGIPVQKEILNLNKSQDQQKTQQNQQKNISNLKDETSNNNDLLEQNLEQINQIQDNNIDIKNNQQTLKVQDQVEDSLMEWDLNEEQTKQEQTIQEPVPFKVVPQVIRKEETDDMYDQYGNLKPEFVRQEKLTEKELQEIKEKAEQKVKDVHDKVQDDEKRKQEKLQMELLLKSKVNNWSGKDTQRHSIMTLLSTLQDILWENSGWKQLSFNDLMDSNQIKKNYYKAIKLISPDKHQKSSAELRYLSEAIFFEINQAYKTYQSQQQ